MITHSRGDTHPIPAPRAPSMVPSEIPDSYGSPVEINRCLKLWRLRAETLANSGRIGTVYLAGRGRHGFRLPLTDRQRARLAAVLAPAQIISYPAVWPKVARPGVLGRLPDFPDGARRMAELIDGMIVAVPPTLLISPTMRIEMSAARAAGVPILLRLPGGPMVPLVDCRGMVYREAVRVLIPAAVDSRETLTVALVAMGVGRVTA